MRNRIVKLIDLEAIDCVLEDLDKQIKTQYKHQEEVILTPEWLIKDLEYCRRLVERAITHGVRA